ncbi:MAG: response regulator transcription factor [Deltaproteobacteria bacterium]|nr:response regulator transcription factor [Deltaproteobacteria bacterium]
MTRILLIDDDPSLLDVLSMALEDAGYEVLTAADGASGLRSIQDKAPQLVVSDVNMPGVDGFALCRRLREAGNHVPLVLLTSRDHDIDETLGLELGADDYVTKPFALRVLLARIAALLRREALRGKPDADHSITSCGITLVPERLQVQYQGVDVPVTLTEFRLLEAFVSRPGIVLSRDRLMELIRGDDSVVADRIIDTYVRRLRRKLEAVDPSFGCISTVVGMGYRWSQEGAKGGHG